jgi:hypothetical protein
VDEGSRQPEAICVSGTTIITLDGAYVLLPADQIAQPLCDNDTATIAAAYRADAGPHGWFTDRGAVAIGRAGIVAIRESTDDEAERAAEYVAVWVAKVEADRAGR